EGHGHRSRGREHTRQLHLPFDRGDGIGEGALRRKRTGRSAAQGAVGANPAGTLRSANGRRGDGGVPGVGRVVVAYLGGASAGWRADSVLRSSYQQSVIRNQ